MGCNGGSCSVRLCVRPARGVKLGQMGACVVLERVTPTQLPASRAAVCPAGNICRTDGRTPCLVSCKLAVCT